MCRHLKLDEIQTNILRVERYSYDKRSKKQSKKSKKQNDSRSELFCATCGATVDESHFAKKRHVMFDKKNSIIKCYDCRISISLSKFKSSDFHERTNAKKAGKNDFSSEKYCGLVNSGSSCWFNSSLQLICRIPELLSNSLTGRTDLIRIFIDVRKEVLENNGSFSPKRLLKESCKRMPYLDSEDQCDAFEFTVGFLDTLRDDLGGKTENFTNRNESYVKSSLQTNVDDCFGFITKTKYKCDSCEYNYHIYNRSTSLSISIPNKGNTFKLDDLVKNMFLDQETNKWKCERCTNECNCLIEHDMSTYPKYLIVHILRFVFIGHEYVKNKSRVSFNQTLSVKSKAYKLFGVICHEGQMNTGHYFSACIDSSKYVLFDDEYTKVICKDKFYDLDPYILIYSMSRD